MAIPDKKLSPRTTVQAWHTALNTNQVDTFVALTHPQVEIGGPRGTARGSQTLREWFGRANLRLLPQRWYGNDNQIVVEQLGEGRTPETGEVIGRQRVATLFQVGDDGLITRIVRHDALAAALEDACLSLEDQVTE